MRGFSLLETIVTLVVVAMIVGLLMQALTQSLNLRSRLLRHQSTSLVAGLQEQWFRESVSAAVADLPDALGAPAGSSRSLELLTVRPLGDSGALDRIRWSLHAAGNGGDSLFYSDSSWNDLIIVPGPLYKASFSYLDRSGAWHDSWQPIEGEEEVLPSLVRLSAHTASGTLVWYVSISADPRSLLLLRPEDPASGL